MKRVLILTLVVCVLTTACGERAAAAPVIQPINKPTQTFSTLAPAPTSQPTTTPKPRIFSPITPIPTSTATQSTISTSSPRLPARDPERWKTWAVIPDVIDPSLQKVYQKGLELGNDPQAFSIFGDCQARPGDFFGVFETDAELVQGLSPDLQELITNFEGSFN